MAHYVGGHAESRCRDLFLQSAYPWQQGANKNINGLFRLYLQKGTNFLVYSQKELDAIAFDLNMRL